MLFKFGHLKQVFKLEDIPILIIDNDDNTQTENDTANISVLTETNEELSNQDIILCNTCPDLPYTT